MKLSLLFAFITLTINATSQEIFQKTISGFEKSISIGLSDGGSVNASHMALQTVGIYDIIFTKHSSIGQIEFTKAYGTSDHEQIFDGKEYLGNYYFCGEYVNSTSNKGLILKLDSNGDLIWAKTVPFATKLTALTILSTGHIAVTGTGKNVSGSDFEIVTQKFDLNGNMVWGKYYQSLTANDEGYSVVEFGSGGVLTVGKLNSGTGYPSGYYQAFNSSGTHLFGKEYSNSYFSDVFYNGVFYYIAGINHNIDSYPILMKINSNGDTVSTTTFGAYMYQSNVTDAFMFNNGILYAGNSSYGGYYMLHIDYNGNRLWQKQINNISFTSKSIQNTILTANNKILLTANHTNGSTNELELISGDYTGDFGCNTSEVTTGYWHMVDQHVFNSISSTQMISGATSNLNLTSLSVAIVDQFLCSSMNVDEFDDENGLVVFPNPCQNNIQLNLENQASYSIMDLTGKMVLQGIYNSHPINVEGLKSGIYFIQTGNTYSKFLKE